MKLLVTGASGFIGRNLLLSLPRDWYVVATYLADDEFPAFLTSHSLTHIRSVRVDLSDRAASTLLKSLGVKFDACIFLAANGDPARSVERPLWDLLSNTASVVNLLETVSFNRFIYFSSGAVYDHVRGPVTPDTLVSPTLPYAVSKLASENYVRHFQRVGQLGSFCVFRFFGAYGPFEPPRKIFSRLVRRFFGERDPRFTIRGDGVNLIDAMFVKDTLRAVHSLLRETTNETVDLYCGNPLTLTELVRRAANVFGLEAEINYEGEVPEYIEFFSVDSAMRSRHDFVPRTELDEGLLILAEHIVRTTS